MKTRKLPWPERLLICGGLLMATMPLLFKEYIHMPDFLRGFLEGTGIGFEVIGLIVLTKRKNAKLSCRSQEAN
jgi:hypothetical protein